MRKRPRGKKFARSRANLYGADLLSLLAGCAVVCGCAQPGQEAFQLPWVNKPAAVASNAPKPLATSSAAAASNLPTPTPALPPAAASPIRLTAYDAAAAPPDVTQPGAPPAPPQSVAEPVAPEAPLPKADAQQLATAAPTDQPMPVDLPTALKLVDANNPTVALARTRVEEAYLRQRQADLAWLPDLSAGPRYARHDGRDQGTNGQIVSESKQSLFVNGGATLDWDTSEILFGPLAAQRVTAAQQANARAVSSDVQLDVANTYFDLLQTYGEMAIVADALGRAEEMLRNAQAADEAQLSKTTADINRARTEVDLARDRQTRLQADAAVTSARLTRLLFLRPNVQLKPNDSRVVPIRIVPDATNVDNLLATAFRNRPELAQGQALVAAADVRLRQARVAPLIPHLGVTYAGGTFGGGVNDDMNMFGARSDGVAEAYWELHNFGAGELITARARETELSEASLNVADVRSRVAEDVTAAASIVNSIEGSLDIYEAAVQQATDTWRKLREAAFGLAGAEHQYDPLQPLIAERDLAQAREQYLQAIIDYNKAQFRLYWALGQPPMCATPNMQPLPVNVDPVPPPYHPAEDIPQPKVRKPADAAKP